MKFINTIKKYLGNFSLLAVSFFFALLLAEFVSRIVLNPVDYLAPTRVYDSILGRKIMPHSGGHDAWGFRNKEVPDSAEIVVIGDSQTYGYNATMNYAFPAQLQKIYKKNVYNMSLGGFGPVQYKYLVENYALKLKPSTIIVGFYFGNDILDAYNTAYGNNYWKNLRSSSIENLPATNVALPLTKKIKNTTKLSQRMRHWLAGHSIIYQLITKVAFKNLGTIQLDKDIDKENYVKYENKSLNIKKYFTPKTRFSTLDTSDLKIQEGIRISINAIKEMNQSCATNHVQYIILLIPTAETVYSDFFDNTIEPVGYKMLKKLLSIEETVNKILKDTLNANGIQYIDMTDTLKLKSKIVPNLYFPGPDGHPSLAGYEVIAKAINNYMQLNTSK